MKFARKILSISTIAISAIVALILIIWLFSQNLIIGGAFIVTLATLAVGGFFAINSINMIAKNKIISWVSLGLICASVLLIVLAAWIDFNGSLYFNIMISFGLLSVLFNIIVSSGLDLGKKFLVVQIIVYVVVFLVDLISTLAIFGAINLGDMVAVFVTSIILALLGIIILKVLAKRQVSNRLENESNMIKISKEEYDLLLDKAKKYDELMLKQDNQEK